MNFVLLLGSIFKNSESILRTLSEALFSGVCPGMYVLRQPGNGPVLLKTEVTNWQPTSCAPWAHYLGVDGVMVVILMDLVTN